jgi:junctophilin
MANARAKAEQADLAAHRAREDSDIARLKGKKFAPEFHQPGK